MDWIDSTKINHEPVVSVKGLNKYFELEGAILSRNRKKLHAVKDVSLTIKSGETFGIVGESGSGKSTLGRLIAGLTELDNGKIVIFGEDRGAITQKHKILQVDMNCNDLPDPFSSLNSKKCGSSI